MPTVIEVFPVMQRVDAEDPALRALLAQLDRGTGDPGAEDAAQTLGEHPSPEVTSLLRAQLRAATERVGPTQITQARLATLDATQLAEEREALRALEFPLRGRIAAVRRIAEALCARRSPEGWSDLAYIATRHPSSALRAAAAGALLGVRGESAEGARGPVAPPEYLRGLVEAVGNVDRDTWSFELRRYGAEAAMVVDKATAFDALAPYLTRRDSVDEYTARNIITAWYAHMKPEDDPRFARALCELLDEPGSVPIFARLVIRRGELPESVDGALAALDRMASGEGAANPYLFEAIEGARDPRVLPAVLRALASPALEGLTAVMLRVVKSYDNVAALPELEAQLAALPANSPRSTLFRGAVRHLSKKLPKAKTKAKKAAAPEALAPGLPVWFTPPMLPPARTGDEALDRLLGAMPDVDAARALAVRRDPATAAAVTARLVEAAAGVCDLRWNEELVQSLPSAWKGRVRKTFNAVSGTVFPRVALVRALAVDLARRWDGDGDAAIARLVSDTQTPLLAADIAGCVVEAEPSRAVLEAVAARLDDPRLTAAEQPLRMAACAALFALGEDRALAKAEALLRAPERDARCDAMVASACKHLTGRSDPAWLPLIAHDARRAPFATLHLGLMANLAQPGSVDAIAEAMEPMMESGIGLEHAVRGFSRLGDARGAEHVLRAMEQPQLTIWFAEAAEVLRKLGDPSMLPRVVALRASLVTAGAAWREPKHLDALVRDWSA